MATAKSKVRLIGLETIRYGPLSSVGTMNTASLISIGNVVPDSAHLMIEPQSSTDVMIEEEDTPDVEILGGRVVSLEFALRDMGTKTLLFGLGGTASAGVWRAPVTSNVVKENCFEVISKSINGKKLKFEIPRTSVKTGGDLKFAKTDSGTLTFSCKVLIPESSTQISPYVVTQV